MSMTRAGVPQVGRGLRSSLQNAGHKQHSIGLQHPDQKVHIPVFLSVRSMNVAKGK